MSDLDERVRGNDTKADIFATKDADQVFFHQGLVIELDFDVIAVREVGLCAETEVANDGVGHARGRRGESGDAIVEQDGQTLKRVIVVAVRRLSRLECAPSGLVLVLVISSTEIFFLW